MSNNDKFIRDTEFGKLMSKVSGEYPVCKFCKHYKEDCFSIVACLEDDSYYFAKDETEEETDGNINAEINPK